MTSSSDQHGAEFDAPILIAGFGSIGQRHFRNLKALGYRNFILYRTNLGSPPPANIGDAEVVTDLDQALARAPRLAIVSNPSSMHIPTAFAAAKAGCHLFIEKPLSANLDGCEELQAVCQSRNLTTMVGCQFRFHPLLVSLATGVRGGRLGKILGARAEWGEYLPNWHPWEDHRKSYSARADLGGGVILTLIHPLDYLYWLCGPAPRVYASVGAVESLQTSAKEDWAEITLEFASGAIGQVHLDYVQRPPVHQLVVWGDLGRATWDYHAGSLAWELAEAPAEVERVRAEFDRNDMFLHEMRHFVDAVRAGRPTEIPLTDGVAVLDIALRAKQSAAQGCIRG